MSRKSSGARKKVRKSRKSKIVRLSSKKSKKRKVVSKKKIKRKKRKQVSKTKYYPAIQKLLLKKGYQTTVGELKNVPFKSLLRYIRNNYSSRVVSKYLPATLVFKKKKGKTKIIQRIRPVRKISKLDIFVKPLPEHQPTISPQQPIADLNQPAPLTQEITSYSSETQKINSIFSTADSHPFDPGLWTIVVEKLPPDYTIPDPEFTARLNHAQAEITSAINAGIQEKVTPESDI
jgi:hypothetical protein